MVGFGWKDLYHPWSKGGTDYSPEFLRDYLINTILPEQDKRRIPEQPPVHLPSRGRRQQLGTRTADVDTLDKRSAGQENTFRQGRKRMRDELENAGTVDRCEKMQPPRPTVIGPVIDTRIDQYWEYTEMNDKVVGIWCKDVVVGVKKQ